MTTLPPPTGAPPPPPTARPTKGQTWGIVGLLGAGAAALGSTLDWATVDAGFISIGVPGTRGDGMITLVLAAVCAVLLAIGVWGGARGCLTATTVVAAVGLAVVVYDGQNIARIAGDANPGGVQASLGIGIVVAGTGFLAALIAPLLVHMDRAQSP